MKVFTSSGEMALQRRGMKDIARAANVSLSTVDRVLNRRGSTSGYTAQRVWEVARRLSYMPDAVAAPFARPFQFDVVIQDGGNTFLDRLSEAVMSAAARRADRVELRLHRIPGFNVQSLCTVLDAIRQSDGVATIALDHPRVHDSLKRLRAASIPIATLVSDIPAIDRFCYVGIDNRAAGRVAGHMIARFVRRPGSVAIFRGSPSYRGHEEREHGCRAYLAEANQKLTVTLAPETNDDVESSRRAVLDLLASNRDLVAIYNVAGGNRGIAAALIEADRVGEIVYIAHELSPHAMDLLKSGVMDLVIDQDAELEGEVLLKALEAAASGNFGSPPDRIPMRLYLPENIPSEPLKTPS